MNLTPRQFGILQLIRDFRIVHGYSPTMHEIASELGISKVTVFEHIETLIKKGALKREPNKARSLSISDDVLVPDETHSLIFPLVGKIAAGYPIEKYPQTDQVNLVDLFGPRIGQQGGTFALRVEGDSMKGEGIIDGDSPGRRQNPPPAGQSRLPAHHRGQLLHPGSGPGCDAAVLKNPAGRVRRVCSVCGWW